MAEIRFVSILTDCVDVAAQEIRYSIISNLSDASHAAFIEPPTPIYGMSVLNGAFLNRLVAEVCPESSILYTVLNPVHTEPLRIVGVTEKKNLIFVGRNTGVFGWVAKDFGVKALYQVSAEKYVPFGGKAIYPPIVAKLMEGADPAMLGLKPITDAVATAVIDKGVVVHIDNFGIAKLYARLNTDGIEVGASLELLVNGQHVANAIYSPRIMAARDGSCVACAGSSLSGLAEVAETRGSFAERFSVKVGTQIDIQHNGNSILDNVD